MMATTTRAFTTVQEAVAATADDALSLSCYEAIDFKIKESQPVYDAVQKFAAFNIGCLVTTDEAGESRASQSEAVSRRRRSLRTSSHLILFSLSRSQVT